MRSKLLVCLLLGGMLWQPLPANAVCGNGVLEILMGEQCDVPGGTYCCIGCQFMPTTTPCRASTGVCDVQENCTGAATTCPADGVKPSTSLCRESPGSVASQVQSTRGPADPATAGTVASTASSAFKFKVGSTGLLRTVTSTASTTLQNFVDAVNALKPSAPEYQRVTASLFNSGAHCQADAPDNGLCLTNTDCSANVDCATTYKVILIAEQRGADFAIVVDTDETKLKFAVEKAAADDPCNAAEKCNGTATTCPADSFQNSAFVCRATVGSCDIQENCTGNPANTCPADAFVVSDTVCRPTTGICDPAEECSGTGGVCPADGKSTQTCRPTAGGCDPAEVCDGTASDCPASSVLPNGTVCRVGIGGCDAAETCDGVVTACPADVLQPIGTVCRASTGQCDVADVCIGATRNCPDGIQTNGTSCDDVDVCTVADQCVDGACVGDAQTCGDGELQLTCGEECDDGNLTDVDGCDSTCVAEAGLGCPFFYNDAGCRQSIVPGRSRLDIRDEERVGGLRFQWKWKNGEETTEADYGDPLADAPAGTSYTLCVYDDTGLLAEATAPAGGVCGVKRPGPCWVNRSGQGFAYADSDQSIEPDGVKRIDLLAGVEGRSYVGLKAEGGLFPLPSNGGFGGIADLTGVVSPLKVQLHNTNGVCFEATFSPPFKRQLPGRLQARAD
jgi:cysteine-rich repeat protein